jgi:hypothetical protein
MKAFLLFGAGIVLASPAFPAILPGLIGPWKQVSAAPLPVKTQRALWDELGLQDSEQAVYQKGSARLNVQTWRVADSTAAMGAFDFKRSAGARPAPTLDTLTPCAVLTSNGARVALGNYLVEFDGAVLEPDDVANLFRKLPRFENSGLPAFPGYLPAHEIQGSERYIGGPVALKEFFPGIEASKAAFHLGAEAAVADYPSGLKLALFSYPLPAIARSQAAEMSKIPNAIVKRSGPLVAVVLHPNDANAAENLLSQVRYQATVTTGEKPHTVKENPARLLLNIFFLIGILSGFCILSGLAFGLLRVALRRWGLQNEGDEMLALHIEGR